MAREIKGAVRIGGEVYTAGREDELAKVLPAESVARLKDADVITGDWKGAASAPADDSDLPEDYPGRKALVSAGLSQADVDALDRDGLIDLKGIGETTADEIIAARG